MVAGEPFFRMQEIEGPANSETRIDVVARGDGCWRYALTPITGRKHQLRVHMAALGSPIANDGMYPSLSHRAPGDYSAPLQLLAKQLLFTDPLSGLQRSFCSGLQLETSATPRPAPPASGPAPTSTPTAAAASSATANRLPVRRCARRRSGRR